MKPLHEKQLMDINTKDIVVDPLGQRDVEKRKSQFHKIMREFNPDLVNPIKVAFVDGKYYCYDGQMTMKVLKARNNGRDLMVSCMVIFGLTKKDAAKLFVDQNGTIYQVKLSDKIRVEANYGDQEAMDFIRLVERNGFRIDKGPNSNNNLIPIQATKQLWEEYKAFETLPDFDQYLYVLNKGFENDPEQTHNKILGGLGLFMRTYKGLFNEKSLIKALSNTRAVDIIRDAEADRTIGMRKYAVKILQAYNNNKHKQNRLTNIL